MTTDSIDSFSLSSLNCTIAFERYARGQNWEMAVPGPFPFPELDTVGKGAAHVLNHKIFKKSPTGARDFITTVLV